jgi:hypothetical protein|tara:strand:- start:276 stop:659 length:384 start_codon:yes stop_codon:yes gene_type:complete
MEQSKYDRRRAIDCKILGKSRTHKNYYKYGITVAETDGTKTTHPVYGKDMQNALKRLMNQEKTVMVEKKLETNTGLIFVSWLVLMGTPALFFGAGGTPYYLAATFGSIIMIMIVATLWYNYITKGKI